MQLDLLSSSSVKKIESNFSAYRAGSEGIEDSKRMYSISAASEGSLMYTCLPPRWPQHTTSGSESIGGKKEDVSHNYSFAFCTCHVYNIYTSQ